MIISLFYLLLLTCSAYAADSYTIIDHKTPLKKDAPRPYSELKHATIMDSLAYQDMRSASEDKEPESLQNIRLSMLSTLELQALYDVTKSKKRLAQSVWLNKFDEHCNKAICASGITTTTGVLLGCLSPEILGLGISHVLGGCLGGIGSLPISLCLTCYYTKAHGTELNEITEYNDRIEQEIESRIMEE